MKEGEVQWGKHLEKKETVQKKRGGSCSSCSPLRKIGNVAGNIRGGISSNLKGKGTKNRTVLMKGAGDGGKKT